MATFAILCNTWEEVALPPQESSCFAFRSSSFNSWHLQGDLRRISVPEPEAIALFGSPSLKCPLHVLRSPLPSQSFAAADSELPTATDRRSPGIGGKACLVPMIMFPSDKRGNNTVTPTIVLCQHGAGEVKASMSP